MGITNGHDRTDFLGRTGLYDHIREIMQILSFIMGILMERFVVYKYELFTHY
jgi:hypothetical protein